MSPTPRVDKPLVTLPALSAPEPRVDIGRDKPRIQCLLLTRKRASRGEVKPGASFVIALRILMES